jgi:hypothetical protein
MTPRPTISTRSSTLTTSAVIFRSFTACPALAKRRLHFAQPVPRISIVVMRSPKEGDHFFTGDSGILRRLRENIRPRHSGEYKWYTLVRLRNATRISGSLFRSWIFTSVIHSSGMQIPVGIPLIGICRVLRRASVAQQGLLSFPTGRTLSVGISNLLEFTFPDKVFMPTHFTYF